MTMQIDAPVVVIEDEDAQGLGLEEATAGLVDRLSTAARTVFLTGIGAAVIGREQIEEYSRRCLNRGEQVERDTKGYAEKVIETIKAKARFKKKAEVVAETEEAKGETENGKEPVVVEKGETQISKG